MFRFYPQTFCGLSYKSFFKFAFIHFWPKEYFIYYINGHNQFDLTTLPHEQRHKGDSIRFIASFVFIVLIL